MKVHRFHPHMLLVLDHMPEDDPDRGLEMCYRFASKQDGDSDFLSTAMFSDEANFYVNGEVNRSNVRDWSRSNPHWYTGNKDQGVVRVVVWCSLWKDQIIGLKTKPLHMSKRKPIPWMNRDIFNAKFALYDPKAAAFVET